MTDYMLLLSEDGNNSSFSVKRTDYLLSVYEQTSNLMKTTDPQSSQSLELAAKLSYIKKALINCYNRLSKIPKKSDAFTILSAYEVLMRLEQQL